MRRTDLKEIKADSFTGTTFNDGRIEVIGWCEKAKNSAKIYAVKCYVCAEDEELYGDGIFKSVRASLEKGCLPCGCAANYRCTKSEKTVQLKRLAEQRGFEFLGFVGDFRGVKTKLILNCELHGQWDSLSISNFQSGQGCPVCRYVSVSNKNKKSDEYMIKSFLKTGSYADGTEFSRSDRKSPSTGGKVYWWISCSACGDLNEVFCGDLQAGKLPCRCNGQNIVYSYVNIISDNEVPIALKFGITSNVKQRVRDQNSKCIYTVENFAVWKFKTSISCRIAESQCKKNFLIGILSRDEMLDGWSETCYMCDLESVISIFDEEGVRVV